jgi:two-component system sensor histidine kinase BarA
MALPKSIGFRPLAERLKQLLYGTERDTTAIVPDHAPPATSRLRVLVVDDNPINLDLTQEMLRAKGLQPIAAASGEQAVTLAASERPDLILMDIQMPGMSGLEAAQIIRRKERDRHIPIIALTAHAYPEEQRRFLAQGMDDCISKPLQGNQLWKLIQRWTGSSLPKDDDAPMPESVGTEDDRYDRTQAIAIAGTEERADQVWNMLLQRLPADREAIRAAWAQGDHQALRRQAHGLRGSAAYCATPALEAAAGVLDRTLTAGEPAQQEMVAALETAIENLLALGTR